MKKLSLFAIFLSLSFFSYSQVKVGSNPNLINQNSLLELESSDKVLVVTRLTNTQMNAITPLNGALVYNTDENCLFQFRNNVWVSLCVDVMSNETVTSFVLNSDGTYTYTNEIGTTTNININDPDSDPTNELQNLSIQGLNLSLSNGGTVTLPTIAGPQGPQGPAGQDGNDGNDGNDGAQGPQGPAGQDGATGTTGATGAQGPQGEIGPQGPAGQDGATGAQGPQGEIGPQGPAGQDGATGATGATGAQGPQGEIGPTRSGWTRRRNRCYWSNRRTRTTR